MKAHSRRLDFFADENFSTAILQILRVFAEHHACANSKRFQCHFAHVTDHCKPGAPDEEWMPIAAAKIPKPIILGGDGRILTHPLRLAVLKRANLSFVCLAEGYVNVPFQQQVFKVLKAWDHVCQSASSASSPTMFRIGMNSKVVMFKRLSEIRAQELV